jgi:hypothetical protein
MATMADPFDERPQRDAIDKRQREHPEALSANTAAMERLEKQPGRQFGIILGDGRVWSGRHADLERRLVTAAMG